MKKFKLRDYQKQDTQTIIKSFDKYNSILYQLPTGGGKTVIIQEIVDQILTDKVENIGKKILILVHRREIIFQIRDRLKTQGVTVGVLIGAHEENIDSDILVGSIRTVAMDGRIDGILNRDFDMMIIDEAHHARSKSYTKVITRFKEHNKDYKLLGVTATPFRKDKKGLGVVFEVLITGPSMTELQKDGFLCNAVTYTTNLEDLKEEVNNTGGDFNITELGEFMRQDHIIKYAIDAYKDKGDNKQMLVFCVNKKHALQVKDAYIKAGYPKIDHIDSDTSKVKRDEIVSKYAKGELDIITSIQTLTEGVDLPETGVIQFLRPTLSLVLYLQMGGRGLRPKADGSDCIILDIANNSREHGLLGMNREWNLDNTDPNIKRKKNKMVGFRADGTMVDDIETIDKEGLELVEMSAEEYFMNNQNGIQEAETANLDVRGQMHDKYMEIIAEFQSKIKIPKVKFKPTNEREYMLSNTHTNFNQINILLDGQKLGKIISQRDFISLEHTFYSYGMTHSKQKSGELISFYSILGKIGTKIINKSFSNKITTIFSEIIELKNDMINVNQIKSKIEEFKRTQIEVKVNETFSKGKHEVKLKKAVYVSNYCRDVWGDANKIVFDDTPKKLRGTNKVTFFNSDGRRLGSVSSFKKDDVISVILNSQK
jgi:superfamily II DNA or RNA helicase